MHRVMNLFLILSLLLVTSSFAANLITNPSFEQCVQTSQTASSPFGWVQSGSGTASAPTVLCTTAKFHTGEHSAQFTPQVVTNIDTGAAQYVSHLLQSVNIAAANQELVLTYWVYLGCVPQGVYANLTGQFSFVLTYTPQGGQATTLTPQYVSGSATAANNWFYQYQARFTPSSAGSLTLSFLSINPAIYIYLDDVSLTPSIVVGDPQFVGLRGQSYQVHGIDGEVYNLVTSPETQVNSKFVFLRSGKCPIINGTRATNCWTHPGSYLGSIGVQQIVNDTTVQLEIVSGPARTGFTSVKLNDRSLHIGDLFDYGDSFGVELVNTHRVNVRTAQFLFVFENSDLFINQQVTSRVALSDLSSHGLFGQTHRRKTYANRIKHIEGRVDDYIIEDRSLFGKKFTFNQFQH